MGHLRDGVWHKGSLATTSRDGEFRRKASVCRNWITADGAPGPNGGRGFPAESGRYHLYVSYACPWAHRTLIFRALKGLERHVSVDVVHPLLGDDGWTFDTGFPGATGDRLGGRRFLREVYLDHDPGITSRVTVPVLWDKETGTIVSNESAEIIRMLNSAFDRITGNTLDLSPLALREEIDAVNARVYDGFNNGVYRAGFARSQAAYERAAEEVFATLDWMEARLASAALAGRATGRPRPTGGRRRRCSASTLVYHGHFKCNRRRIVDYPNLWAYARELYQWPGVAGTVRFDHIAFHYYASHRSINPTGIVPVGPAIDWKEPHGRAAASAA